MPLVLAAAVVAPPTARAQQENSRMLRDRFVLTDREAYGLEPAELICGPSVDAAIWSPDARYVVALRTEADRLAPPGSSAPRTTSLVVWNRRARYAREVWNAPAGDASIEPAVWLNGSPIALAVGVVTRPTSSPADTPHPHSIVVRISADSAAARVIADDEGDMYYRSVEPCPTRPVGLLVSTFRRQYREPQPDGTTALRADASAQIQLIRPDGSLGAAAPLPPKTMPIGVAQWAQDGRTAYLRALVGRPRPGEKPVRIWLAIDLDSLSLRPVDTPPPLALRNRSSADTVQSMPVALRPVTTTLREGDTSRMLKTLWLESARPSAQPRAFVSAECGWGELSPTGDAVLYIAKGAAWCAPVRRMSRDEYSGLLRQALMTDGKEIGLAILMYAQDYDENWPTADGLADKLGPYAKDDGLFAGFNYAYPGATLGDVQEPASTVIGTIDGPGGKVNVYADGHVKWIGSN